MSPAFFADALSASRNKAKSPLAIAAGKRMFYEQIEKSLDAAYLHASEVMACNVVAEDGIEGMEAFVEKREPEWRGR